MRSVLFRVCLSAVIAALAGLALVSTAFAHAEPDTIAPADGSTLTTPPTQVVMTTTEEMDPASDNGLHVVNANGTEVTTAAATLSDDHMTLSVPLPANLPAGVYTVKWNTVSAADGDAADGTFTFTVAAAQPSPTPTTPAATTTAVATPSGTATAATPVAPGAPGTGTGVEPAANAPTAWLWGSAAALALSLSATAVIVTRRARS